MSSLEFKVQGYGVGGEHPMSKATVVHTQFKSIRLEIIWTNWFKNDSIQIDLSRNDLNQFA